MVLKDDIYTILDTRCLFTVDCTTKIFCVYNSSENEIH